MDKIVNWAKLEQKLVVVARDAVNFSDGTDLTPYYMRLGFKKLEMDDGTYDLVYSGTAIESELRSSDTDQRMVKVRL